MRIVKRNRGLGTLVATAVGFLTMAGSASATVSSEQSGAIVVWPKVVWNDTRDTLIEVTNTGNPMLHARCYYINASDGCSETDFSIWLTRQQPTHWLVSQGRNSRLGGGFGTDNAGLSAGLVPPVPPGFQGELKCIEVDETDTPVANNKLTGQATLIATTGDVSRYNAVSFPGNPDVVAQRDPADPVLTLDLTDSNPGGQYSSCPDVLLLNHFADGQYDPALSQFDPSVNATLQTFLTLVPCTENLENQIPGKVTVQFQIFNEFEQPFSTSTTAQCWLNTSLSMLGSGSVFTYKTLGTPSAYSRITPNPGQGGVIGIAEELRSTGATAATAAYNLNFEGNRYDAATDGKGNLLGGAPITDTVTIPVSAQ